MKCEGKIAIVMGAAGQGMGRSIALTLSREGADVVVNYRTSKAHAQEIVKHIQERGGNAIAVQADIFTAEGCKHLFDATICQYGRADICVVGPGAGWHPESPNKLNANAALADLHDDVAPLFYMMPLVLPGMVERTWGRLVGLALHPTKLPPAYAYNVAKTARAESFRLAVNDLWGKGVTVNTVAPGPISHIVSLTEAIDQCEHGENWKTRDNVSPQDVAEGVAFLCSESGRFVTGCVLPYMFNG